MKVQCQGLLGDFLAFSLVLKPSSNPCYLNVLNTHHISTVPLPTLPLGARIPLSRNNHVNIRAAMDFIITLSLLLILSLTVSNNFLSPSIIFDSGVGNWTLFNYPIPSLPNISSTVGKPTSGYLSIIPHILFFNIVCTFTKNITSISPFLYFTTVS